MSFRSWMKDAFTRDKTPKVPTRSDLYSGPQAQFGAYDPNTGAYTPTPIAQQATRQFANDPRSIARRNAISARNQSTGWSSFLSQRASDAQAAQNDPSRGMNLQQRREFTDGNSFSGLTNDQIYARIGQQRGDQFIQGRDQWNQTVANAAAAHAAGPAGPGARPGGTGGVAGRPTLTTGYQARPGGPASMGGAGGTGTATHPVAMASVRGHDAGRQAAEQALSQLQQVSREGWTPLDRLALDAAQRQSAMGERSQRDALLASSRARGVGGSALGFASALGAQQGAANRSADYATQIGLAGRERALGATQAAAGLGMGLDDQAFSQAAQRAAAVDAANMWFTGKQDDAAAMAYQAQLAAAQAAQQRAQQRAGMIMGGVGSLFNMGTGLGSLLGDDEEG